MPKIRAFIAIWLRLLADKINSDWGRPGFNQIYYKGKRLDPDVDRSGGRVVSVTAPPEYTPDTARKGGRMVRIMPRQLKKIKDGQEQRSE